MKTNYNLIMNEILKTIDLENVPSLLLHSCCGPCSTEVISRLTKYFNITILYYNPNIEPEEEYIKRKNEQIKFIKVFKPVNKLEFLDCDYDNDAFFKMSKGYEDEPEGAIRCHLCYKLRLKKTLDIALENGFDYFGTTLTVSPYKNAQVLNAIGEDLSKDKNIKFLYSDFKKEDGYKKSIQYSKEYNLYRQEYCGCHFSQNNN